ncbi:hypothetical protein CRG98_026579 [Punica granatum]|uniref:Uncharacterized protein n=1 Tax=Punica granatum TaxID=22663 RepID=A0A2I0J9T9_PUNGR|nr:hypothetical protein CRG98_026579 [Punica granatum]
MSPLIDLPHPEQCSIELTTFASCAFSLTSPKIKSLKLEAFGWIKVSNTGSLRSLSITNPKGVRELDRRGGLPAHEYLSTSVCPWCWRKMSKVLRSANKVEHLKMAGSNFIGPSRPTLQVDIVDFFRNHPKLERLEINDHKLAVLSAKNTPHDAPSDSASALVSLMTEVEPTYPTSSTSLEAFTPILLQYNKDRDRVQEQLSRSLSIALRLVLALPTHALL